MAQKTIHPYAEPVALRGQGETAFLLIHGYTGSPSDFNGLARVLHDTYGVSVFVPLLPGHGTRVEDLRGLTKDDFVKAAEEVLVPLLSSYKKVIVGGHSFGAQVAIDIAARFPVEGVFVTALPYKLCFPLSIPWLYDVWHALGFKEFLKKRFSVKEKLDRARALAYDYSRMPAYGLKLLSLMNTDLRNKQSLSKIRAPFLSIFFKGDPIAHPHSGHKIQELVGSEVKRLVIMNSMGHGVFFTEDAPMIYKEIAEFFKV